MRRITPVVRRACSFLPPGASWVAERSTIRKDSGGLTNAAGAATISPALANADREGIDSLSHGRHFFLLAWQCRMILRLSASFPPRVAGQ